MSENWWHWTGTAKIDVELCERGSSNSGVQHFAQQRPVHTHTQHSTDYTPNSIWIDNLLLLLLLSLRNLHRVHECMNDNIVVNTTAISINLLFFSLFFGCRFTLRLGVCGVRIVCTRIESSTALIFSLLLIIFALFVTIISERVSCMHRSFAVVFAD